VTNRDAKLERLREMVNSDEPLHPTDLVDRWDGWAPTYKHDLIRETGPTFIPTREIVGTDPINTDRLDEGRLVRIVNKLATDEWDDERSPIHVAQHPNGEYYVHADGNHRTLAFKFFEYDLIYAEVTRYDTTEQ
jgi:hypothetical protein